MRPSRRGIFVPKVPRAIREAIDSYPGGICLSAPDGRVILVNRQMNEVVYQLVGHTVIDAEETWTALGAMTRSRGCEMVATHSSLRAVAGDGEDDERDDLLAFRMSDGSIWQLRRTVLDDDTMQAVQIVASDISDLYRLGKELSENNARLAAFQTRQKSLLANIVEVNREKELLAAKMRVHDELGRCLVATRRSLSKDSLDEDVPSLKRGWEEVIRNLSNLPSPTETGRTSPESELLRVAEMIGCTIEFIGEKPTDGLVLHLMYAAIREALTNAVRYAGADRLTVSMRRDARGYHVEISSNGRPPEMVVRERGGLGNLRRRLEEEGASLTIGYDPGVVLVLDIPVNCGADGSAR